MEIATIIGTMSLAMCMAGTILLLVVEENTPKLVKVLTGISIIPLIVCFAILAADAKEKAGCKVKYERVKVELYKKVE